MTSSTHRWRFFRAGGFDQVRLDTGADLAHLAELDQKLWVALSCPTQGVELDAATLALVDTDADGHVRAPELIAAIDWAIARLRSPDVLVRAGALALVDINGEGEDNAKLLGATRRILASLGKADATHISVEDCTDIGRIFGGMPFNGDGVIAAKGLSDDLQAAIATLIDRLGAVPDRSGEPGVNRATVERFFEEGAALQAWRQDARAAVSGLPEEASAADVFSVLQSVRAKVDDFFQRCQLAAFDPRAANLLNGSEDDLQRIGSQLLGGGAGTQDVATLPLAYVSSGASLPLSDKLNPAWAAAVQALYRQVVRPLLGDRAELSEVEWRALVARFADFEAWQAARPETPLDQLDAEALAALLAGDVKSRLLDLVTQDEAAAEEAALIGDVERLVRYTRDLAKLANNFVAFTDFYTRRDKASFQAGTLYIDGRSSDLCVKVLDSGKHAALATLSGVYLAYCECSRAGEKLTIAAAITAGDADQLMAGRNGVFYDRQGRDWDATIVKIVDHPISIRQAFWTPYKKVSRLIGEQVQKFAASKAQASTDFTTQAVAKAGEKAAAGAAAPAAQAAPPAPPAPVDAAKFAGIFAAVGLAIGAIGTALAAVVTGFLGLKAWQMPLALLGLMLLISGPSMAMAFFKLRNRNLGPILDANGWAVNTRARINIPFGAALTQLAKLPDGAERALTDPYAEKRSPWKGYVLMAAITLGVVLCVHWMGGWPGIFPPAP
ncbi:hypothetical protein [Aquabacterium parvum]|uniref:hypothetical protein n=1 Tax=Aquabacterium parvum TaxID=70584 RepID=UPI000718CB40|nr:hypothetical protein [Aquabacterium parvum]MBU0915094.1 hypothetical protein [Gammaproteobacteria bacterium]